MGPRKQSLYLNFVATALTVYGIETFSATPRSNLITVATALTVYGIETFEDTRYRKARNT